MVAFPVPHSTVAGRAHASETRSGSRFLAVAAPAPTPADAAGLLAELRDAHPGATHHCSAWRVEPEMASSDDGEPGGTAGRPMLEVLLKRGLDRVAVVCVRWYGGTKLGAGGLVRAYSTAAARALDAAGTRVVHDTVACRIHAPFARADAVHRLVDEWRSAEKGEVEYTAAGPVVPVRIRAADFASLSQAVAEATAGDARIETAPAGEDG